MDRGISPTVRERSAYSMPSNLSPPLRLGYWHRPAQHNFRTLIDDGQQGQRVSHYIQMRRW
jgi:hypothetical protein